MAFACESLKTLGKESPEKESEIRDARDFSEKWEPDNIKTDDQSVERVNTVIKEQKSPHRATKKEKKGGSKKSEISKVKDDAQSKFKALVSFLPKGKRKEATVFLHSLCGAQGVHIKNNVVFHDKKRKGCLTEALARAFLPATGRNDNLFKPFLLKGAKRPSFKGELSH